MEFYAMMFALFSDCYAGIPLRLFGNAAHQLPAADIYMNGRRLRVLKHLGEGGYAMVYLVKQIPSAEFPSIEGNRYALKRILAGSGEKVQDAKREIEVMQALSHPSLLNLVDSCIVDTTGADSGPTQTIYMLFPAFEDGTLAAEIDRLHGAKQRLSTHNVLHIFRQVCAAIGHMHERGWAHRDVKPHNVLIARPATGQGRPPSDSESSMSREDQAELGVSTVSEVCYRAVVMDFGSARPARVEVHNRFQALELQEEAEAHCTATYRAPELFDVPSRCTIDERVDIWSLGCTLYHLMYGSSPFQKALDAGGSLALAVVQGRLAWPKSHSECYPQGLHHLVSWCVTPEPGLRPAVPELLRKVDELMAGGGEPAAALPVSTAARV